MKVRKIFYPKFWKANGQSRLTTLVDMVKSFLFTRDITKEAHKREALHKKIQQGSLRKCRKLLYGFRKSGISYTEGAINDPQAVNFVYFSAQEQSKLSPKKMEALPSAEKILKEIQVFSLHVPHILDE